MELSALPQTSDPPRGLLFQLVERLIYPFLRGEPPKPQQATGFYTDTTVCIGWLQGLRGGVQAVEPTTLGWL
jgi:formate dehydrogenase iron-sulfur subunit